MVLPPKVTHPTGEQEIQLKKREIPALVADTFAGKIHIEWDPQAQVTPLGQLSFFIQYLKVGCLFEPWHKTKSIAKGFSALHPSRRASRRRGETIPINKGALHWHSTCI